MELSRGVQVAGPVSKHGGAPRPDRDITTQLPQDVCKRLGVRRQVNKQSETSGARLEPPIPSRMMSETSLSLIDSANARSRGRCGETIVNTSSQPRRLAICC